LSKWAAPFSLGPEEKGNMAAENIINATETTFKDEVLQSGTPVLVDFWAEWCGPCKMLSPVLDELAGEYNGKVKIAKVNVDQNPNLASEYRVISIPMLLFFKNGQVTEQLLGFKSKKDLKASLDRVAA
jgi:thioredoxin 1